MSFQSFVFQVLAVTLGVFFGILLARLVGGGGL